MKTVSSATPAAGISSIDELLTQRGVRYVSFADWEKLDALEVARGEAQARPRVKTVKIADMLSEIDQA